MNYEFKPFPKIGRLAKVNGCIITEKIDGTNASVFISETGDFLVGSRTRWITPESDNYGFAKWAYEHKEELLKLGPGHHFGEWWGQGVQRGYGLKEKKFSLFNTGRWSGEDSGRPECCDVVPVLGFCEFFRDDINQHFEWLREEGSKASPGFMKPEGIMIFHIHTKTLFKKTFDGEDKHKFEATPQVSPSL